MQGKYNILHKKASITLWHLQSHLYLAAVVAGVVIFEKTPRTNARLLTVFALTLLTTLLIFRPNRLLAVPIVATVLMLFAGASAALQLHNAIPPPTHIIARENGNVRLVAVVEKFIKRTPESAILLVKARKICTKTSVLCANWQGKVLLRGHETLLKTSTIPGDVIVAEGRFAEPATARNPGGKDWRTYYYRKGISGSLYIRKSDAQVQLVGKAKLSALLALRRLRELAVLRLAEVLPKHLTGTALALALGDRSMLDKASRKNFAIAGTSHLLAISGLHVGILTLLLVLMLRLPLLLTTRNKFQKYDYFTISLVLTLPFVWFFVLISGANPPALRAAVMISFWALSRSFGRRISPFASLFYAAIFILLVNPESLFEVSFMLTFAAVFSILLLAPIATKSRFYVRSKHSNGVLAQLFWFAIRRFFDAFWVSVAGFVATAPIVFYTFKEFTPAGLVSNAFLVPIASVFVVPLAFVCGVWALFNLPFIDTLTRALASVLDAFMSAQTAIGNALTFNVSAQKIAIFIAIIVAIYVAFIAYKNRFNTLKTTGISVGLGVFLFAFLSPASAPKSTQIVVLNAGFNSAILVRTPQENFAITGEDYPSINTILKRAFVEFGIENAHKIVLKSGTKREVFIHKNLQVFHSIFGKNSDGFVVKTGGKSVLILTAKPRKFVSILGAIKHQLPAFDVVIAPVFLPCSELLFISKNAQNLIVNSGAASVVKAAKCAPSALITGRNGAVICTQKKRSFDTKFVCKPFY